MDLVEEEAPAGVVICEGTASIDIGLYVGLAAKNDAASRYHIHMSGTPSQADAPLLTATLQAARALGLKSEGPSVVVRPAGMARIVAAMRMEGQVRAGRSKQCAESGLARVHALNTCSPSHPTQAILSAATAHDVCEKTAMALLPSPKRSRRPLAPLHLILTLLRIISSPFLVVVLIHTH
jgi:hypothetical protein